MTNQEQINPLTTAERIDLIVATFDGASSTEDLANILSLVALQVARNGEDYAVSSQLARDIGTAIGRAINA